MKLWYRVGYILFLIILLFVGCSSNDLPKSSKVYLYPILPGTKEWKELDSHQDMVRVCQIPDKILSELNDYNLLITVLQYPLFDDIYLFNNIDQGFKEMSSRFNGFSELSNRKNIQKIVEDVYTDLTNTKDGNTKIKEKREIMLSRLKIINKYFFKDFDLDNELKE